MKYCQKCGGALPLLCHCRECLVCGADLRELRKRSGARTCSPRCRKAFSRNRQYYLSRRSHLPIGKCDKDRKGVQNGQGA